MKTGILALCIGFSALLAGGESLCVTGHLVVISRTIPARFYLMERREGVSPFPFWVNATNYPALKPGDLVTARLRSTPISNNQKDQFAESVECVKTGEFPTPALVSGSQINGGELDGTAARVRGVLAAAIRDDLNDAWNLLTLRTAAGKVHAAIPETETPLHELLALRDAEVELSGLVTPFGIWRRFLGYELMLFGARGIRVLVPPPADPFSAPGLASENHLHRQTAEGTVLAVGNHKVFLRTSAGTLLPVTPSAESKTPSIGERLLVSGFTEPDQRNLQLVEAEIRSLGASGEAETEAEPTDVERLFSDANGYSVASTEHYGRILKLNGKIANSTDNINLTDTLILACGKRTINVDVSAIKNRLSSVFEPETWISVIGLCIAEFESSTFSPVIPRFKGFTLIPRSETDIVVLSHPPWWTPAKFLVVIIFLSLLIIGILIWNRSLHSLSEKRGRELAAEQLVHAESELKVEERTRLAVEIHDSISQTLTGIALQLETAKGIYGEPLGRATQFLDTARQMLASCRQELRCCIWDLRSRTFEEKDMSEAVQRTISPHTDRAKVTVRFNVPRERLSESTTHTILKIIRELVVNAIRHGNASHIRIAGEYREGRVGFSVSDNGCGFDPRTAPGPSQGHFGLQGIRERAAERQGNVEVRTHTGTGTKVIVTLVEEDEWPNENA